MRIVVPRLDYGRSLLALLKRSKVLVVAFVLLGSLESVMNFEPV